MAMYSFPRTCVLFSVILHCAFVTVHVKSVYQALSYCPFHPAIVSGNGNRGSEVALSSNGFLLGTPGYSHHTETFWVMMLDPAAGRHSSLDSHGRVRKTVVTNHNPKIPKQSDWSNYLNTDPARISNFLFQSICSETSPECRPQHARALTKPIMNSEPRKKAINHEELGKSFSPKFSTTTRNSRILLVRPPCDSILCPVGGNEGYGYTGIEDVFAKTQKERLNDNKCKTLLCVASSIE